MMKRMCMLGCALTLGGLFVQVQAAPAGQDGASALVTKAEDLGPAMGATGEGQSAEDAVQANLAKLGVGVGYIRKMQAIIAIGTAEVLVKDPANEKDFMLIRSAKANEAYLDAKAKVIQAIYTELSAEDRLAVAGEFVDAEAEGGKKPAASAEPTTTQESTVKLLSKMPLLGSSVLTQAESWDAEGQVYSVSMAIVWSPKMQESALAQLSNGASVSMAKGHFTPQEWAARQSPATMIGPRRFTDSEGNNIFVGIAAVDLTGKVKDRGWKKKSADLWASRAVAFSLAGDLETYAEASRNLKEYDDDKRTGTEKLASATAQKCEVALQGCTQLRSFTGKHPISGRTIYVSMFYCDPVLAKDAGALQKKAYEGALRQAAMKKKSGSR